MAIWGEIKFIASHSPLSDISILSSPCLLKLLTISAKADAAEETDLISMFPDLSRLVYKLSIPEKPYLKKLNLL
jgi:hypothetical protein